MHPKNLFTVNILVSEKEKSDDLFNLIVISCFLLVFCCFVHLPLVPLQVTGLFARVAAPVTFEGFLLRASVFLRRHHTFPRQRLELAAAQFTYRASPEYGFS